MNRKCKKLKTEERVIKHRKSDILVRPQFSRHPIPRRKKTKFPRTSAPKEVDATGEVLLGSTIAGPTGVLIGLSSATARAFGRIGVESLKTIRDTAEETREREKKKPTAERRS